MKYHIVPETVYIGPYFPHALVRTRGKKEFLWPNPGALFPQSRIPTQMQGRSDKTLNPEPELEGSDLCLKTLHQPERHLPTTCTSSMRVHAMDEDVRARGKFRVDRMCWAKKRLMGFQKTSCAYKMFVLRPRIPQSGGSQHPPPHPRPHTNDVQSQALNPELGFREWDFSWGASRDPS